MKLNKEQIQTVEKYLANKDVEYIDLHFEVLDHISSDIETKMTEKDISFFEAFDEVKLKWNEAFSYKSTYWFGTSNGGSKLFIDYCLKIYKPLSLKIIIISLLIPVCFYLLVKVYNIDLLLYKTVINNIAIGFSIIYLIIIIFWKYKLKQDATKSTFSYMLKIQVFPNIIYIFLFLINDNFNSHQEFKYSKLILFSILIATLFMGSYFYKNHQQVVSNYKKYQLQ